jgi:hypothetical protein
VRSLERVTAVGKHHQHRQQRILKPYSNRTNNLRPFVNLCKDGREYNRRICYLVLENFVSPRPSGMYALYHNNDKSDARLENLYWGPRPRHKMDDNRRALIELSREYGISLRTLDLRYQAGDRGKELVRPLNVYRRRPGLSGEKNIYWHKQHGKWHVVARVHNQRHSLGLFDDLKDAVAVRDQFIEP